MHQALRHVRGPGALGLAGQAAMSRPALKHRFSQIAVSVARWFDDQAGAGQLDSSEANRPDWFRVMPFLVLHLACLGVIWVGWSWTAVGVALGLYAVRMFAITAGYHRYFCHRAYTLSRFWQLIMAILGNSAAQRGPLWWAANHRHHHMHADEPEDVHSPVQQGFLWSHMLWLMTPKHFPTRYELVRDWAAFPELRFLNRFSILVPLLLLGSLYAAGELLGLYVPGTDTSGPQLAVWGFVISTVALFHATATINSLDHLIGSRRYDTPDNSRNNWLLALMTFGEGWHNNHHHYAISARQGFTWWELDLSYYLLVLLSWLGIARDLRPVPAEALSSDRIGGSQVKQPD